MTRKGVWNLQQVRDKYLQSLWANDINLYSWGRNNTGNLGLNSTSNTAISSPVQVGTESTWRPFNGKIGYYSEYFVVTTKTDGTLWTWGRNTNGELGQNNTVQYSSPVQIPGTTWSPEVSVGSATATAIKTDGTLWTWGNNYNGYLGHNEGYSPSKKALSSPTQIPGTTWSKAFIGAYNGAAVKTDGTLWMWGRNNEGNCAQNQTSTEVFSSPIQIGGDTNWSTVHVGSKNAAAVKTDGTLWCWGQGNAGMLAQNNTVQYSSPVQVPGTTWSDVWTNEALAAAMTTNGELFVWGSNSDGRLGQNQTPTQYDNASSPIQISGEWSKFSYVTYLGWRAIKTDGTMWGSGRLGSYGEALHTDTSPDNKVSSPTQIGSVATWKSISSSAYGSHATMSTLTPSQL